jgi:hypothetical protein
MKIELIPVLEIIPILKESPPPAEHPFWQHTAVWDQYQRSALTHEGYSIRLEPYLKGFPFYAINSLLEEDVTKVVSEHIKEFQKGEYLAEELISLSGGYILKKDGENKSFPQCCGELSDIAYWISLANGDDRFYIEEHPTASIKMEKGYIFFDFSEGGYSEPFAPPPTERLLQIERSALQTAVTETETVLNEFALLLKKINLKSNWGLENIDRMLIWNDAFR